MSDIALCMGGGFCCGNFSIWYNWGMNLINNKKTKTKFLKGFTLVELMVVIAIIGVLSSIVIANLNTARMRSRDTTRIADIKNIQSALEFYFDANRQYPPDLNTLVTSKYVNSITDPVNKQQSYAYTTDNNYYYYHLGAALEDSSNAMLNSSDDRDCGLVGGGPSSGSSCFSSVTWNSDFNGGTGSALNNEQQTNCGLSVISYNGYCFDVTPSF